jgi:ribose/xylose/arabinose/galactoside ABC-type transport system permease subunit
MVFEDSSQSGVAASRYFGEGFRDLAVAPASAEAPVVAGVDAESDPTVALGTRVPPPNLDLVFDDPADGEPGRDRMIVHGIWELILAIALAVVGYLLYREDPSSFSASGIRGLLLGVTMLGLAAAAIALSLRAAAPNLAVGTVAVAASVYFGQHARDNLQQTVLILLGAAVAVGVVQGLLVVGLQVPAWAASLAVALALAAWMGSSSGLVLTDGYSPDTDAYLWFGGFCAVSLVATLLGLIPTVRRGLGRFRAVADPARRRGVAAGLIVIVVTVVSTLLGSLSGVLSVLTIRQARPGIGLELTALALGAALLGGTSAFGRRGGILGTIFAAGLITVVGVYSDKAGLHWPTLYIGAVAIALGLGVTRLVERFGRPSAGLRPEVEDDWTPKVHALTPAGRSWQPAPTPAGGMWASDDAWGSIESR